MNLPTSTSMAHWTRAALEEAVAIREELARREVNKRAAAFTKAELADLEAARAGCVRLGDFVKKAWRILEPESELLWGWALDAMCLHLEAVTRGDIQFLLINVPPGMMKSLLVSVLWPAWEWGPCGRPTLRYLTSSYSQTNVVRDNTKMRSLVESDWYQGLWPHVRKTAKWGEKKFVNTKTGEREGRPFKSMTGGRGDRVGIDDPHSTETAESDADRKTAIRIWREAIPDRTNNSRSAIVVIMQRLHSGDVSGTILEMNPLLPESKRYVHLCLPMRFDPARRCSTYRRDGTLLFQDPRQEEGELLFPERFDEVHCLAMETVKGPYAWAGQYQQSPTPRDGALFDVDRIRIIKTLPAGKRKTVRGWDFAASLPKPGTDPDWSVGLRISKDEDGFIYIEDVKRVRKRGNEVRDLFKETATRDGWDVRIRYPQDPGAAGKSQAEDLSRAIAGFSFTFAVVTGAKEVRATPIANQIDAGNVFMVEAPWNLDLIEELRAFPTGKHDDQVDALADAFNELAGVVPGEGLIEYYRQEAEKVMAQLRGEAAVVAESDMVVLKAPPTMGMAVGQRGTIYNRGADGLFRVHPEDAPGLLRQAGWERAEDPLVQEA